MILKKLTVTGNTGYQTGLILLLLIAGAPFFFLGGPGPHGARSFIALWNMGHVLFFSLASFLFCRFFRIRFPGVSQIKRELFVFLIVLVSGTLIEALQMGFDGRSPDVYDILRNLLGCLITFVFFDSVPSRKLKWWKSLPVLSVLFLLLVALYPLFRGALDEIIAEQQFPVLSDFETVFEENRWSGKEMSSIEKGLARHGNHALKIQLGTDLYSGVGLRYFPGNWLGYTSLHFSIFYPGRESLRITCRIHDTAHNNEYTDRFNRSFMLRQGWNDFVISLTDIQHAPLNRLLNLAEVENVKFFVVQLDEKQTILLDYIYLEK